MSGLTNTSRRLENFSRGQGYKTDNERKAEKARKKQAPIDKLYAGAQIPDEELIRRNERRKAASRRGSRIATVLTDEDTLG